MTYVFGGTLNLAQSINCSNPEGLHGKTIGRTGRKCPQEYGQG